MDLWHKTIGSVLDELAYKMPEHEAVVYNDRNYRRTWKELNDECDIVARAFMSLGIGKGDHVAIWATNIPEWLLTFFAAVKLGAVLVTINTAYKAYELKYLLSQSDTKLLVMSEGHKGTSYIEILRELCPDISGQNPEHLALSMFPCLHTVITVTEDKIDGMLNFRDLFAKAGQTSVSDFRALTESLSADEVINMQYTSGTTGFPKGVMLTHKGILNNGRFCGDSINFTKNDRLCIPVPFFHSFAISAIMECVSHGSTMVPIEYFRPEMVLKTVYDQKCTALHGVPAMFIIMLNHCNFNMYDLSSLRTGIIAGSPCLKSTMEDAINKMGMKDITIAYGLTEASPGCTISNADDDIGHRISTVGRDMPFCENVIVDSKTGEEVPDGLPGEFCTRGYHVMRGYYKMPEETSSVIDKDGFLHTGDLAVREKDGYYRIIGRIADTINRGGENIYPKEIEEFLITNSKIRNVQIVGVPSKIYGEEVAAFIVLKDGENMTEDEVKLFASKNIAGYKVPSFVFFVESFPMTASKKVQKFKLRKMATELITDIKS